MGSENEDEAAIPGPGTSTTADGKFETPVSLTKTTTNGPVYSVFTPSQKHFIIFMASWAGFFSPVSATIYLPALNPLAEELHVSNTLINLTLTSYMIFQGLAPAFIGALADNLGRRPAYTICFIIYIAANIGLALQDSYAALMVLRCVQSSGSSATIAMASAVVADVATPSERGSYMGFTLAGSLLGPALGPVIGGILAQFLSWRAIFWFLVIFAGLFLAIFLVFFPETARNAVGNGSIAPQGWNMSLMNYLAVRKARRHNEASLDETAARPHSKKLTFPNPLASLSILLDKQVALLLGYNALLFAASYDITATVPSQFAAIYKFNDLQIGLCFLPFGIGCLLASLVNGFLLDWNFARWCRKLNLAVKKGRDMDLREFPIERVRLEIALPLTYVSCALLVIYGWVMDVEGPLAVLLVVLFFVGFTMNVTFNAISTLIVDFFPTRAASATASNNLLRCLLGAGATAVVVPMINAMGRGWTFTFLALVLVVTSPMIWINFGRGIQWREERRVKEQAKTEALDRKKAGRMEEGVANDNEKEIIVEGGAPETLAAMPQRHTIGSS